MQIELVGELVSKWGEGPVWWQGALFYVDIEGHCVVRWDSRTGQETLYPVGERVGVVVPRADGGLVVAGDSGFHLLDPESGELTAIEDPEPTKENNRFNDGKCSPEGRFFAGTISLVKEAGDAALYCLEKDLRVRKVFGGVTNSNGLAWSQAGDQVYYIDTPTRSIQCFDYDAETGAWSKGRQCVDTGHIDASPDGMTIDGEGQLWVAFCHGGCVVRFDPETGKETQRVELPCVETTSCTWGGENLDELYVTTGIHKSLEEKDAGRVFVIKGLGLAGSPAVPFAG